MQPAPPLIRVTAPILLAFLLVAAPRPALVHCGGEAASCGDHPKTDHTAESMAGSAGGAVPPDLSR
jgi:hypothetical protein